MRRQQAEHDTPLTDLYYFAFGSNMDAAQMATRCPGATSEGPAYLDDHELVFRGPSKKRGGGVLSVDSQPGGVVEGILYKVDAHHLQALDRFEGAPEWYVRQRVEVRLRDGTRRPATLYRLPVDVQRMKPTEAYLRQVLRACHHQGFESARVEAAAAQSCSDPQNQRIPDPND